MERILVGVDGSAPSLKAVDFAADLASKYNAELILLKVVEDRPPELEAAVEAYARSEHMPAAEAELVLTMADDILDNARREALAKGATQISIEPSFGEPAAQIVAAARDRESRPDRRRQPRSGQARRPPSRQRRSEGR